MPKQVRFEDLIQEYSQSPEWRSLRYATRRWQSRAVEKLTVLAESPLSEMRRRDLLAIRDELIETPGVANQVVTMARKLMQFGVDREYVRSNPFAGIKALPVGERKRWPTEVVERALGESEYPIRLAILLAVYTAQRVGDILTMKWDDYDGDTIHVIQAKTGVELWIPCFPKLRDELDRECANASAEYMIHTRDGKRYSYENFSTLLRRRLPWLTKEGWVFHGLRKSATAMLAEAGCTDREIMAITGHKTTAMVSHYTREADQKRRAKRAIHKLTEQ